MYNDGLLQYLIFKSSRTLEATIAVIDLVALEATLDIIDLVTLEATITLIDFIRLFLTYEDDYECRLTCRFIRHIKLNRREKIPKKL